MPDIDDLSNFSEGMHVNPLPASEVRRRGDRMRRRNAAFATVGGVVAAAVFIGTPLALINGNNDDDLQPAPQPTPTVTQDAEPTWLTEVPEGFPVTEGMVTSEGDLANGDLDAFALCDFAYPRPQGTVHAETWFFSGDGESSATRTFQLWPDDSTAEESLTRLIEAIEACPQQPTLGGEDIIETRRLDFDLGGDDSVTFTQQVVADDGLVSQLTTVEVTRVGNAVLVDSNYGSAGGDEAIAVATQVLADHSQVTRDAMSVFSGRSSTTDDPSPVTETSEPPTPNTTPIPEDFPLARGMDDTAESDVVVGENVEGAPVVDVCGTDVFSTSGVGHRLAARETGIEYLETRELMTFITSDEPIEALTTVRDAVRDCPHMDGEFTGYTTKILKGAEGYDSFTWGSFADDGLDGGVYQITRVGSAVLVLYAAGETSESSLQPVADNLTQVTLELAPEMCVFTEDGC